MIKTKTSRFKRKLYWLDRSQFETLSKRLISTDFKLSAAAMTPCETLKAKGTKVVYASPATWSRVCSRQGSWYRSSDKMGKTLVVSETALPTEFDSALEAHIEDSDFLPSSLPGHIELENLVNSETYKEKKPLEWENAGIKDSLMFKVLFSITRFWGRKDSLKKYWLNHRANHANFLEKTFTTEIEGESVPYTVSENAGTCSSCVEFFNVIEKDTRKLVRACPGSITFGGVQRDRYYDVKPVQFYN